MALQTQQQCRDFGYAWERKRRGREQGQRRQGFLLLFFLFFSCFVLFCFVSYKNLKTIVSDRLPVSHPEGDETKLTGVCPQTHQKKSAPYLSRSSETLPQLHQPSSSYHSLAVSGVFTWLLL